MSSEIDQLTFLNRSVMNSGRSLRVTLPADVCEEAGVQSGDTVSACYDREKNTITYFLD